MPYPTPAPAPSPAPAPPHGSPTPVPPHGAPAPAHPAPKPRPKPKPRRHGRGPLLQPNAIGEPVRQLQRRLQQLGYYHGPLDGKYGKGTRAAVRKFQRHEHLEVDGIAGKHTWDHLGVVAHGKVHYPRPSGGQVRAKLLAHQHNGYWQVVHQCFHYAWTMTGEAGGKSIGNAPQSSAGRWKPITYLAQMERDGRLHVGDVIYANIHPGADPSSTNMAYRPHWFVYIGNGQFADQYGIKGSAAAMQAFVSGRVIDTIYHTFG
jgi:hypothetical protein